MRATFRSRYTACGTSPWTGTRSTAPTSPPPDTDDKSDFNLYTFHYNYFARDSLDLCFIKSKYWGPEAPRWWPTSPAGSPAAWAPGTGGSPTSARSAASCSAGWRSSWTLPRTSAAGIYHGRCVADDFLNVMVDLGNRVLSGLSLSASLLVVTPGVVVPSVGDLNETHEKGQKSKELWTYNDLLPLSGVAHQPREPQQSEQGEELSRQDVIRVSCCHVSRCIVMLYCHAVMMMTHHLGEPQHPQSPSGVQELLVGAVLQC